MVNKQRYHSGVLYQILRQTLPSQPLRACGSCIRLDSRKNAFKWNALVSESDATVAILHNISGLHFHLPANRASLPSLQSCTDHEILGS